MPVPQNALRRALFLAVGLLFAVSAARSENFDFDSLRSLIRERHIGSVEDLIAALPETQRNRYALVFASRSAQDASFENPRAILFGPDARLVMTFNGNPTQRGFRAIETMEFDAAIKEFRFREILFPEGPGSAEPAVVSEDNPERCTECHGNPPRPVWDTAPLWPGAYGERYRTDLSPTERTGLSAFLAQQAEHPRYRHLVDVRRFAEAQTFRAGASGQYAGRSEDSPNAELTIFLSRLRAQSIARQLAQRPAFDSYQYVLLGVADDACGGLADFYPDPMWRIERERFERFARESTGANARQAELKGTRATAAGGTGGATTAAANEDALLKLRFVAESALRVSTQDWTLALEMGTYDFTMPPLSAQPLRAALLAAVASSDPAVSRLSAASTSSDGDRYCSYLRRRSKAVLGRVVDTAPRGVAPTPVVASDVPRVAAVPRIAPNGAAAERPAALHVCVTCHESGVGPRIPFSSPVKLAQQLQARPAAHGVLIDEIRFRLSSAAGAQRMPLGLKISDGDRRSLEAYFAGLAAFPN